MHVLVTGATGFVGSHTVAALHAAGHTTRCLVRSIDKAHRVLGDLGVTDLGELVIGDITDAAAIAAACVGCDAVIHTAALVALDRSRSAEAHATNTQGVENIVAGATAAGCDPIISVSSAAVFALAGSRIDETSTLAAGDHGYSASKTDGERFLRGAQAAGAPIAITYPSGVLGPTAPSPTDMHDALKYWLEDGSLLTSSGINVVDVRDVAQAHVALLKPGQGPRRYVLSGHYLSWLQVADQLDAVTGVKVKRPKVPGAFLRNAGRLCDSVPALDRVSFALTAESMSQATEAVPTDGSAITRDLGLAYTDRNTTFADSISWLATIGAVRPDAAGRLATS